jgi:hypothetical protein
METPKNVNLSPIELTLTATKELGKDFLNSVKSIKRFPQFLISETFHIPYLFGLMNTIPYGPKTAIRKFDELHQYAEDNLDLYHNPVYERHYGQPEFTGDVLLGSMAGIGGLAAQAYLYYEHPSFLAIPIITNIASAIYEKAREIKQDSS